MQIHEVLAELNAGKVTIIGFSILKPQGETSMSKEHLYNFLNRLSFAAYGRLPDIGFLTDERKDIKGKTFTVFFPASLDDSDADKDIPSYFQ